jgi:hypothetical protein
MRYRGVPRTTNNTPPAHAIASRGILSKVRGYMLYGNYAQPNPAADINGGRRTSGRREVTRNCHVPSHRALRLPRREETKWLEVEVRSCKYLNNNRSGARTDYLSSIRTSVFVK